LTNRAIHIFTPQFLAKGKTQLTKVMLSNGYSHSQINQFFHSFCKPNSQICSTLSPPCTPISLPYIKGTTDHISKNLAKKNIKTLFKHYKVLNQLFRLSKDKFDLMLDLRVYKTPCTVENLTWDKWVDPSNFV